MTRTVAFIIVLAAVPAAGQRFEAVESRTRAMGAWVAAVADLDGDGLDDVLLADYWEPSEDGTYTAEDPLVKGRMYEYRSLGDRRFRAAPLLGERSACASPSPWSTTSTATGATTWRTSTRGST